jgi:hypothetical protein
MIVRWFKMAVDTALLAIEAQTVIALRMARLAGGGAIAAAEAERMSPRRCWPPKRAR